MEISTSIRRFLSLIISSLLFVVVYILVIIIVTRASSVFGSFWMVSRETRSYLLFYSILPFWPPPYASVSLVLVRAEVYCHCSCLCCLSLSFPFIRLRSFSYIEIYSDFLARITKYP
jgi:hypothetical protein